MASNKFHSPAELSNAFMIKLEDLISELISQNNIACYRIESALETLAGFGEERYIPVIRIVTYFENSIAPVVAVLNDEFDVEMEQPGEKERIALDSFASKRLAYSVALKPNRQELTEYKKFGSKHFKIHVCSMLQDAWAGIEKELGYSSDNIPEEARRDFYRVGALLEMADLEFLKIRSKLSKEGTVRQPEPEKEEIPQPVVAYQPERAAEPVYEQPGVVFASKPIIAEPEVYTPPPVQESTVYAMPPATEKRPDTIRFSDITERMNVNANGIVEKTRNSFRDQQPAIAQYEDRQRGNGQVFMDENAPMTEATLREYVLNSKLLAETDSQIATNASARLNNDIDIEGDIERLRFLKVVTLRQLHEQIAEHKREIIAFAEKWIGKDNGGTFDKGISLFYLEYLLVGKRNDQAFAVEYVLKFISDNEYSARYIIPTYDSIMEAAGSANSRFSHLTLKQ